MVTSIIKSLHLPQGEWVVFGGACLTAHEIRPTSDIELFVSRQLYEQLSSSGWEERVTGSTGAHYVTKLYDEVSVLAFITCGSDQWRPAVEEYLSHPEWIDGVPYMPLSEMYKWKAVTARPKDLIDINLIEDYWEGVKVKEVL